MLRTATAKETQALLTFGRACLSGSRERGCRTCGFVPKGWINRPVVVPAIRRSGTPIPIIDQQRQAQIGRPLCFHGLARDLLRRTVGDNTVASIAATDNVEARN